MRSRETTLRNGDCSAAASPVFPQADRERLVAIARDGSVLAVIDGGASNAAVDGGLDLVLHRSGAHVRLTHNHPRSTGLSGADLEQLTKPGLDSIEAVGLDGSRYEAARGPRFDGIGFEPHQYRLAAAAVSRQLLDAARSPADRASIDAHHAHLTALALHKAGIIVYAARLSGERSSSYERNRAAFGRATEAAAVRLRQAAAR
jgi:hypothetical protein